MSQSALHCLRYVELDISFGSIEGAGGFLSRPYSIRAQTMLWVLTVLHSGPSATDPVVFEKQRTLKLTMYQEHD